MIKPYPQIFGFTKYFEDHLKEISNFSGPAKSLHQKIMYVSILDAMSKSVYPHAGNHQRFTSFIERFADWPDSQMVSLLHLLQALNLSPEPAFEELRKYAISKRSKLEGEQPTVPTKDVDPSIAEVKSQWPKGQDYKFPCGVDLSSIQHIHLFYSFRNFLIHELRTPGQGFEATGKLDPYYAHIMGATTDPDQLFTSTELVYPTAFCYQLCRSALKNLKQYLEANVLNPYQSYDFGTYWIENLNT